MSQHPTTPAVPDVPALTDVAARRRRLRQAVTALVLSVAVVGGGAGVAHALDRAGTTPSQAPAPIVEEGSGADDSTTAGPAVCQGDVALSPAPLPVVEEGSGADDSTTTGGAAVVGGDAVVAVPTP